MVCTYSLNKYIRNRIKYPARPYQQKMEKKCLLCTFQLFWGFHKVEGFSIFFFFWGGGGRREH